MDGDAQVECLQPTSADIAVGEAATHAIEDCVPVADRLADDELAGIFKGLADPFASGYFAYAGVAGAVLQDDDIAGEVGAMGAAEIQQHAVLTRDRDDAH